MGLRSFLSPVPIFGSLRRSVVTGGCRLTLLRFIECKVLPVAFRLMYGAACQGSTMVIHADRASSL